MNELPERTRTALVLHTVEGLKLREVAERPGLSVTFTHQLVADGKIHCMKRLSLRALNRPGADNGAGGTERDTLARERSSRCR